VGASLLAKAACQPTGFWQVYSNPVYGAATARRC
jgi:hypothetical protein